MPIEHDEFSKLINNTSDANEAALERIGLSVMQVAQPLCPVDTGNLRRSHKYRVEGDSVVVGATADYAAAVHNGTSKRKGQPWLRNSVQRNKQALNEIGARAWVSEFKKGVD